MAGLLRLLRNSGIKDVPLADIKGMQKYLDQVQAEADRIRQEIQHERNIMGFMFVGGYGLGSFLVLLGGILKLRLRSAP